MIPENIDFLIGVDDLLNLRGDNNTKGSIAAVSLLNAAFYDLYTPAELKEAIDGRGGYFMELDTRYLSDAPPGAYGTRHQIYRDIGWNRNPRLYWDFLLAENKLQMFQIPLLALFAPVAYRATRENYVVYAHTFVNTAFDPITKDRARTGLRDSVRTAPERSYIGVTRQGWTARWKQHLNAAAGGCPYLFHNAIRAHSDSWQMHEVWACGLTYEEAMDFEERLVESYTLYPRAASI